MIWTLLIVFQFKHYIADYILQGEYMLGKFKAKGWVLPLASHCGVHLLFTMIISNIAGLCILNALLLSLLDFFIHMLMDRIKASPDLLGRYKALSAREMMALIDLGKRSDNVIKGADLTYGMKSEVRQAFEDREYIADKKSSNVKFWYALGFDQLIHHLTDILIVYMIMRTV